jgi:toxin-antitoxin system PIN domain toxin
VILPDVNVLLYAYNDASKHHPAMRAWWEESLSGARPIGMSWVVVLGFIRIATNPRVWDRPMRVEEATERVRLWLASPAVEIVGPGAAHSEILFGLLETAGTAGNLTTDAHLAALAIEYQAEVATTDRDFGRFRGVRWFNPAELNPGQKPSRTS